MNQPWLQEYSDGIPATIDPDSYPHYVAMLDEACAAYSDHVAYRSFDAPLTYGETDYLSRHFAAWLQQEAGVRKGDRVAVMMPNMLAFPVAMFGILRAGGVQVNVNPLYTPRELQHQLSDADVDTIVIYSGSTPVLAEIIADTPVKRVIVAGLDDMIGRGVPSPAADPRLGDALGFTAALERGAELSLTPVELGGDDLMFLQYTGGTTGLSKGAMLTHRNIIANILQYRAVAANVLQPGDEIVMTAIPMYHIFALTVNTLAHYWFGAENVLITNPKDLKSFAEEWCKRPVTVFTAVNTLFNGLNHTPRFADADFSRLHICVGGGAPVQAAVSDDWKAITGRHIPQGYGLSETSPVVTLPPFEKDVIVGSIGIPLPSTDVSIRADDGSVCPVGEAGELCVKGPQVMPGYWRRDDATAEVMTDDGYFRTGDIATMDEQGYFRIVDRKKDMILVSGFNVYPNEIEQEVQQHEGVLESACVGIPHPKTGEAVALYVVKKDPDLTDEDIREFCRERLTAYKVPTHIEFIDELPKSTVGKVLRRELRDRT